MSPRVYLSGPMSGLPEFNYPAFFSAEEVLQNAGYTVENPARNQKPEPETWENYMRLALAQLTTCHCIALLSGWENSRGAQLELFVATTLGLRVLNIPEVFPHEEKNPCPMS